MRHDLHIPDVQLFYELAVRPARGKVRPTGGFRSTCFGVSYLCIVWRGTNTVYCSPQEELTQLCSTSFLSSLLGSVEITGIVTSAYEGHCRQPQEVISTTYLAMKRASTKDVFCSFDRQRRSPLQ